MSFTAYTSLGNPKSYGTFVIVRRQVLLDSKFSTAVCAPIFSSGEGLSTQLAVGREEGMKLESWITCDNLVSARKADITNYVGSLSGPNLGELNRALRLALDLP